MPETNKPEFEMPWLRWAVLFKGRVIVRAETKGDAASVANKKSMARVVDLAEWPSVSGKAD